MSETTWLTCSWKKLWIRCSDDCQDDSSLGWSQVNSRSCPVVVGFLQTRFLFDESVVKPWDTAHVDSHCNTRKLAKHSMLQIPKSPRTFCTKTFEGFCWLKLQVWPRVSLRPVLATSGTTSTEGESIGISWKFGPSSKKPSVHSGCDAALAARDAEARKSEAMVAAVDNFDLSGLSEAASRKCNLLEGRGSSNQWVWRWWRWKAMRKTLTGTLVTVMTSWMKQHTQMVLRQMTQNFLNQFETLMPSASQVYALISRSFQDARELLSRVKSARGYFLVVGIGAFDGLTQPSTDRKPAKARKARGKGNPPSQKGGKSPNLGTPSILPEPQTSRTESRPPMSMWWTTSRSSSHNACCVDKLDHRASECPNQRKRDCISLGKRAFGTCALGCAVFDAPCYGATVEETEQGQDENDGGATKTVSGFMSIQPVTHQYEDTTIGTTDVGFTFAGGKHEHLYTTRWVPARNFVECRVKWVNTFFSSTWMCYVSTVWSSETTMNALSEEKELYDPETTSSSGLSTFPVNLREFRVPVVCFGRDSGLPHYTRNSMGTSGNVFWNASFLEKDHPQLSSRIQGIWHHLLADWIRYYRKYYGTWKRSNTRAAEFGNTNSTLQSGCCNTEPIQSYWRNLFSKLHDGNSEVCYLGKFPDPSWTHLAVDRQGDGGPQDGSTTGGGGLARVPNLRVCKHLYDLGSARRLLSMEDVWTSVQEEIPAVLNTGLILVNGHNHPLPPQKRRRRLTGESLTNMAIWEGAQNRRVISGTLLCAWITSLSPEASMVTGVSFCKQNSKIGSAEGSVAILKETVQLGSCVPW